jgi:hypothetical protein
VGVLVSDLPPPLIYLFLRVLSNPMKKRLMSTTKGCIPAPTGTVWRGCEVSVGIREVSVATIWVRTGFSITVVVEEGVEDMDAFGDAFRT